MTFVGGPVDAGEHLLGVRAVASAISAADLAGGDGGPDGLFGAPVGRVDRRVPKESEHRGEFEGQMSGESFCRLQGRWLGDQPSEAGEQSAAGGRPTMVGRPPRIAAVAQRKGSLHPDGPPAAWVILSQLPRPPEQVGQTGLVQHLSEEAAIRRPPIAHQHPGDYLAVSQARGSVETGCAWMQLATLYRSGRVCERTDDDKTPVLAVRT